MTTPIPPQAPPVPKGIHHVTVLVADLSRSLAFYRDLLGLKPDPARPAMEFPGAWLDLGAGQQIHLMQLPAPEPARVYPAHGGRDRHVALLVEDLPALLRRLADAGIEITSSRSGRAAAFCRDPDGNALEFIDVAGD